LPLIGAAHDVDDGIWLAAGHEGLGVTTSLGTAKLLAAQMLNHACPLDPAAFAPRRFSTEHAHD
jgi:glycine/D-amino acid oxidase-like deaminating enzyme